MDVRQAIRQRRSVRRFEATAIPEEHVEALVEAAMWAPSAGNLEARVFLFTYSPELRSQLCAAALNQTSLLEAPLVVVACADLKAIGPYGQRG